MDSFPGNIQFFLHNVFNILHPSVKSYRQSVNRIEVISGFRAKMHSE